MAYRINKGVGKEFGELLKMYLRAYRVKNGEVAKRAKELMVKLVKEVEKLVGEDILPEQIIS